jgi:hypothetical protein
MSATPVPNWSPPEPRDRWGPGRVIALILGLLLLLPALGLLAGGGALLVADQSKRTGDGYLMSPTTNLTSTGYALVSPRVVVSAGADWVPVSEALGTTRLRASGGGKDLFVGIAPADLAAAYLDGVQRTVVDEVGNDAGAAAQTQMPGGAPAGRPGDQTFWAQQATGSGPQQVDWSPATGNWTVVVMNADGSAGVNADLRAGATVPALTGIAWGLLVGGLVVLLVAVLVIVLAVRRRSPGRQLPPPTSPDPVPLPAGPPPATP